MAQRWVVKLGGSLETAPGIRALLRLLVDYGRSRVVIVPGGGRFADRVRSRQSALNLDDKSAHVLAIRAMEQYAGVLCGMNPHLQPIVHSRDIEAVNEKSALPIWLPGRLLEASADIPASWKVTSDSLALWFAERTGAEALILIKSAPNESADVRKLAASGYLDEYFPELLARTNVGTIACVCMGQPEVLRQALISGAIPPDRRLH